MKDSREELEELKLWIMTRMKEELDQIKAKLYLLEKDVKCCLCI